ncbi:hypothetical protein GH5_08420 [Leishmania sp. Ghana 2012 LV757]|uniref:hypothetical protein n=1 Tax=Leishmania sp. Ghana 2012 LV757 TaxID=2803181 RepID=UPI001B69CD5F|nr:hypothetical protein GH5_08420 [Leishmania sp. Ghana 2012 LV757]
MRKAYMRVWAPLASGTFTPSCGSDLATGTAALHASWRGYAVHNSSHDRPRGRRGEHSREPQCGRSASLLRSASRMATDTATGVVHPSPHARGAFYSFIRSRNAPFVSGGTTTASPLASDAISSSSHLHPRQPSHLHSNVHFAGSTERHGAPAEEAGCVRGGTARNTSSGHTTELPGPLSPLVSRPSTVAAPVRAPGENSEQQQGLHEGEAYRGGASTAAVLCEWTLDPPDALTRRAHREGGPQSRPHRPECGNDNYGTERDANGGSVQRGRPSHLRDGRRRSAQQRRHYSLERARRQTSVQISNRHLHEYEQACRHAYRLLKQVEWRLATWARARRRGQAHADSGHSSRGGHAGDHAPKLRGRASATGGFSITPAGEDIDAVDARFFEYAGQIRRTLHQLTPRHFDAVREYRLRGEPHGDSPSTAVTLLSRSRRAEDSAAIRPDSPEESPPQLLLLRLLWRLLHIQQLFFSIGRRASLPRSAVDVYVQSSNCQYGIREVLRVLGGELARSTLSTSAKRELQESRGPQRPRCSSCAASSSALPGVLFSNKELFQLFYAVLCIPSEEAPGVSLCDPSVDDSAPRRGGAPDGRASASPSRSVADAEAREFLRECIATGGEAAHMPLDEWCVRWWAHQYYIVGRTGAVGTPPLSMGESMDVLRACMYATTSVQVRATSAQQRHRPHQRHVNPFMYFETPPQGATGGARQRRTNSASAPASKSSSVAEEADSSPLPELDRRYRPQLSGPLGGNRTALRIPYHLGQRYVEVLLTYLLSSASAASVPGRVKESVPTATETVAAAMERLLGCNRDAVRDVALLCTAILFFEVFSPNTAAFMAHAAPLCREQVELLSGHEISCVLLAYASLQRWERAGGAGSGDPSTQINGLSMQADGRAVSRRAGPLQDPTVAVQSASTAFTRAATAPGSGACGDTWQKHAPGAAAAPGESPPLPPQQPPNCQSADARYSSSRQRGAARSSSSSHEKRTSAGPQPPSYEPWHLFYVTLASRAGQLSDTLSEDDVTRVLLAMELTGLEHDDLRRALQSSLRMRNMGQRVLCET